jgi:hypothetical protein
MGRDGRRGLIPDRCHSTMEPTTSRCRLLFVLAPLGAAAAGVAAAQRAAPLPLERPFSRPAGPHAVGAEEHLWVDSSRAEPFTKDPADRRRMMVQIWYPAEPVSGAFLRPALASTTPASARR